MTSILQKAGRIWREFSGRLTSRHETDPVDSAAKLQDFVATRAAYVAQKTLYGYVKARMGTRYPRMFEDDVLMASLNIAKQHVFAACLSDLTVYAVAIALHDQPIGNDAKCELAQRSYEAALNGNVGEEPERLSVQDYVDEFERRLEHTDWRHGARQPDGFTHSPRALFRWAPIADAVKKHDTEIVENSIRFAWREIREQLHKRIDGAAICADWLRQTTN